MRHFFVLCLWSAASLGAGAQLRDASSCGPGAAQPCRQSAGAVAVAQLDTACGGRAGGCKAAVAPAPQAVAASAPAVAPAPSWGEYGRFLLSGILAIALVTVLGRRLY